MPRYSVFCAVKKQARTRTQPTRRDVASASVNAARSSASVVRMLMRRATFDDAAHEHGEQDRLRFATTRMSARVPAGRGARRTRRHRNRCGQRCQHAQHVLQIGKGECRDRRDGDDADRDEDPQGVLASRSVAEQPDRTSAGRQAAPGRSRAGAIQAEAVPAVSRLPRTGRRQGRCWHVRARRPRCRISLPRLSHRPATSHDPREATAG